MSTKVKKVKIHIIHSMKGGCGKSACSLFKALELAHEKEQNSLHRAEVLFLDADFRGSAQQWLLLESQTVKENSYHDLLESAGRNIIPGPGLINQFAIPESYSSRQNLNRYLKGECETISDVLVHSFSFVPKEKKTNSVDEMPINQLVINGYLDFIFSSSNAEEKRWFSYTPSENRYNTPALAAGKFSYRMNLFLNKILFCDKLKLITVGQYEDIVIDMPPGYDEYSDLLLNELRKIAKNHPNVELHYYSVTTSDVGHLHLTSENISEITERNGSYDLYNTVNVILNCMREGEFSVESEALSDAEIMELRKTVQKNNGKVYLSKYVDSYYQFCRSRQVTDFERHDSLKEL